MQDVGEADYDKGADIDTANMEKWAQDCESTSMWVILPPRMADDNNSENHDKGRAVPP